METEREVQVGDIRLYGSFGRPYLVVGNINNGKEFALVWLKDHMIEKPIGLNLSNSAPSSKHRFVCNVNQIFMNIADSVSERKPEDE